MPWAGQGWLWADEKDEDPLWATEWAATSFPAINLVLIESLPIANESPWSTIFDESVHFLLPLVELLAATAEVS